MFFITTALHLPDFVDRPLTFGSFDFPQHLLQSRERRQGRCVISVYVTGICFYGVLLASHTCTTYHFGAIKIEPHPEGGKTERSFAATVIKSIFHWPKASRPAKEYEEKQRNLKWLKKQAAKYKFALVDFDTAQIA